MPSLADIPLEILLDNLLPLVPLKDILSLTVTNKDFAALCSEDTFWKRKLQQDYNFCDASSARTKGYKFLYKGVHKAKVYVWGSTGEGRLGLGSLPCADGILNGSRPYPTQLKIPGSRIVELAAGGWSFHALDSEGCVHVWGELDGLNFGNGRYLSFSNPTKQAVLPTKLILPEKISKISCGRAHAMALSSINRVWVFTSWGRPYVLTTPLLSISSTFSTPCQVECGWGFSAVLTYGGEAYVWWPLEGALRHLTLTHNQNNGEGREAVKTRDNVVQCRPWEISADPGQIKDVATSLPKLREGDAVGDKIVKIAAGENFLIGLTEGGHVLKADLHRGHVGLTDPLRRPKWEYLPCFSEVERVRTHPTFSLVNAKTTDAPETLQITHISAHFLTFFAYSTGASSIVLSGSEDTLPDSAPHIQPGLQNRGVISVVLGDYHFGALTSTGKLLTWGAYSSGALGLGDPTQLPVRKPGGYETDRQRQMAKRFQVVPPDCTEPTEVKFGTKNGSKGRKSFVFVATASGWHTGALVIDLEDAEEEDAVIGEDEGNGEGEEDGEGEEGGEGEEDGEDENEGPSRLGWWRRHMPFRRVGRRRGVA